MYMQHKWWFGAVAVALLSVVLVMFGGVVQVPSEEIKAKAAASHESQFDFKLDIEGRYYDLTKGEYIVAFMSDTCEECREALPSVNEWTFIPEFPPVVGLLLSDGEETLKDFRDVAEFPVTGIDTMKWFSFIADAPPSYYLIRDGEEVARWDHEVPPLEELLPLLTPAPMAGL